MVQAAHVLIGGGTGFVGRHLVQCLRKSGAKVRVITRKASEADLEQDQISWTRIKNDGLPKETTAVVNLAGKNILEPGLWTDSYKKECYDSRLETNRCLVNAIHTSQTKKVESFVTISGVGYYKPSESVEYDENWTQPDNTPKDYLMSLAKDWEHTGQLDEHRAPTTRRVIIRSGVVLGHDGGVVKNLKLPFSLGLGGPLGSGNQWFPWIHVEDLANMFKFAIINEHVEGIINGVAPEQVTNKGFASAVGKVLNRPAIIPMPSVAINLVFGRERSDILLKGQRVKSRAGILGFRYQYPSLRDACNECLTKH